MAIIVLLTYLIGSYFSLMRCYANAWESRVPAIKQQVIFSIILSWFALMLWIIKYFDDNQDYFFKVKNYKEY